jgi:hypothetical protein
MLTLNFPTCPAKICPKYPVSNCFTVEGSISSPQSKCPAYSVQNFIGKNWPNLLHPLIIDGVCRGSKLQMAGCHGCRGSQRGQHLCFNETAFGIAFQYGNVPRPATIVEGEGAIQRSTWKRLAESPPCLVSRIPQSWRRLEPIFPAFPASHLSLSIINPGRRHVWINTTPIPFSFAIDFLLDGPLCE